MAGGGPVLPDEGVAQGRLRRQPGPLPRGSEGKWQQRGCRQPRAQPSVALGGPWPSEFLFLSPGKQVLLYFLFCFVFFLSIHLCIYFHFICKHTHAPSIHWFVPRIPTQPKLGQAELRAWNSVRISCVGDRDSSTRASVYCLPGCALARN